MGGRVRAIVGRGQIEDLHYIREVDLVALSPQTIATPRPPATVENAGSP